MYNSLAGLIVIHEAKSSKHLQSENNLQQQVKEFTFTDIQCM